MGQGQSPYSTLYQRPHTLKVLRGAKFLGGNKESVGAELRKLIMHWGDISVPHGYSVFPLILKAT